MRGSVYINEVISGAINPGEMVSLYRSFPVNPGVSGAPPRGPISGVINEEIIHYTTAPFMGSRMGSIMST